jgi:hypothetical protein
VARCHLRRGATVFPQAGSTADLLMVGYYTTGQLLVSSFTGIDYILYRHCTDIGRFLDHS